MTEQSHKREMNEAVRADFERLRERRGKRRRLEPAAAVEPDAAAVVPESAPGESRLEPETLAPRRRWPHLGRRRR